METRPSEPAAPAPACFICGAPAVVACALCKRPACGVHSARHRFDSWVSGPWWTGWVDRFTCDECCPRIPGSKPTVGAMFFGLLVAAAAALVIALFALKPW